MQPIRLIVRVVPVWIMSIGVTLLPAQAASPHEETLHAAASSRSEVPDLRSKLWIARYNVGPAVATDVAVSPDGAMVFVTGDSGGDYATVAYDTATGVELWVATYEGPGASSDTANALAVSPDGAKVFVTGSSYGVETQKDYATVAYDVTTGTELWVTRHDAREYNDTAYATAVSLDGATVFVTGASSLSDNGSSYATIAYDTANGSERWTTFYVGFQFEAAYSMGLSPDGAAVFVTGYSGSNEFCTFPPCLDYATVAYDTSTGIQQWAARYDGGTGEDYAYDLGLSPDGATVFVTGESGGDYATVAYDSSTGIQQWVALYNGFGFSNDVAHALSISLDGGTVFVTGESGGDYATLAYEASTGIQQWEARAGSIASSDAAYALALAPDGVTLFVLGDSGGRYAPIAYLAATGARRGAFQGVGGSGSALAMNPDGSTLFVTGTAGTYPKTGYGTVAYDVSP